MDQLAPLPHSIDSGIAAGARVGAFGTVKICDASTARDGKYHISEMRNLPRLSCPSNAAGVGEG